MDKKEYKNDEITVVWKADKCIHSGNCVRGLSNVFKPQDRPWIQLETASTEEIKNTIDNCPSGALTYYVNGAQENNENKTSKIELVENGPMIVHGAVQLSGEKGDQVLDTKKTAFCRCGASAKKPYCDGTHRKIEFKS